ncbi:MAG: hypothetical protein EOO71_09200 [Myxococcaceae bacterium]|nr:MAG: hypothetical protein EOO71_09200 [Myxococcaceae bacterium]
MKNTPQNVTYRSTTTLPLCLRLFGPPTFALADTGNIFRANLTCLEVLRPFATSQPTFFWGDGGASTLNLTQTRVDTDGVTTTFIAVGMVTAGRYQGAIATRTLVYANVDVTQGCLSANGLLQTNGTATLVLAFPN